MRCSETSPDGTLDVSKSQPENIPCFVKDAKKHVCYPKFRTFKRLVWLTNVSRTSSLSSQLVAGPEADTSPPTSAPPRTALLSPRKSSTLLTSMASKASTLSKFMIS
jgi:hypothetical protein